MTKPSRMIRALTVAGLAGLVLTGCAGIKPGVAAEVGDREITNSRVDEAAQHLCMALEDQLEAENNTLPMGYLRQGVVQLLTVRAQVEQVADEYGVEPGSVYASTRSETEATAASLPEEAREDYVELSSTQAFYSDIAEQVGRIELERRGVTEPTPEQVSQAGSDVFTTWPNVNRIDIDPRYGLETVDGELAPVDTNLSVAVSDRSVSGMSDQPDPAYARTLPAQHRCG